jgi:hypothetical protein
MIAAASIQRHNADVFQAQRAAIMLHPEMFDAYRKMTPSERLTLTLEMSMTNYRRLWAEPPDVVARRFEVLRLQNDERKRRGGTAIARTREPGRMTSYTGRLTISWTSSNDCRFRERPSADWRSAHMASRDRHSMSTS